MATVEEVEILISKLLADKAKLREEGVKELLSYLDASGGVSLCPLLDRQTALFSHPDKLLSSTWPGVVRALCQCNKIEYNSNKKRAPKPIFPKALRNVIQKAEDRNRAGASLFLPQDVKNLFFHLLEAIVEAPSFVPDYSHIIRQLVTVSDYCSQMTKQVYAKLVGFFMEKMRVLVNENTTEANLSKEEGFRTATTLHCLLQNPPEEFLEKVREPLVEGLSDIFLHLRDEGRVARKLVASLNMFLLKDGVNLGDLLIDLHSSFKGFIMRTWKVTRDRELKDELVLYGRLQLKLRTVVIFMEGEFIHQMLQLVEKDLDQTCAITFSAGSYRFDGGREGKFWTLTKGMRCFLELAASILFEASMSAGSKCVAPSKKQKKEDVFATLTDRLIKGNCLWWGAFCLLVRYYHQSISNLILFEWLNTLNCLLERALSEASSSTHSFEALVWILRCLQELSAVWPSILCVKSKGDYSPSSENQCKGLWESVWVMVLHWLPLFSSTSIIVEESFKLLAYLLVQSLLSVYSVPRDFWALKPFTETPSGSVLFFMASFFSSSAEQVAVCEDLDLWKKLLNWAVLSIDKQEHLQLKTAAILALTVGYVPHSLQPCTRKKSMSPVLDELEDWAKLEDCGRAEEEYLDALEELVISLVENGPQEDYQGSAAQETRNSSISFPIKHALLKELADSIIRKVSLLTEGNKQGILEQSFNFSSIIISCINGVVHTLQRRGQDTQEWSCEGGACQGLSSTLNKCISIIEDSTRRLPELNTNVALVSWQQNISEIFMPETRKSLKTLLFSQSCSTLEVDDAGYQTTLSCLLENLLLCILTSVQSSSDFLEAVLDSHNDSSQAFPSTSHADDVSPEDLDTRILDADFDVAKKTVISDLGGGGDTTTYTSTGACLNFKQQWKLNCVITVALFAQQLPEKTCDVLLDMLQTEDDPKVQREILLCLCKSVTPNRPDHVPFLVNHIESQKQSSGGMEAGAFFVLTAVDTLLTTLLASRKSYNPGCSVDPKEVSTKWNLPKKVFIQLAKLLADVSQNNFPFWHLRGKFAEAIAKLNLVEPSAADDLLDKFLDLLHDVDYRVRCIMSKKVKILFQAYTGHEELFQDICSNIGLKMVMATKEKIVRATDVCLGSKDRCFAETAVMTLGEVAAASEKVEVEAVFMICANAAIFPDLRLLSCATLNRLARQLHYPTRWKYLSHLLCCIFSCWVKVGLPLPTLVEIRELLVCKSEPVDFLKYCCPLVLPSLLVYDCDNELTWLAKVMSRPISTLVKESSAAIFSALLPLYCHGDEMEKKKAVSVLQGKMLALAKLSEDDRDHLIKKNMVSIVNGIFQLCSSADSPQFPLFSKKAVISSVRTVVDGFCGSESPTSQRDNDRGVGVKDVLKIFRADRVFMFILQIHLQIETAFNSRHRCDKLAGLACLIDVIKEHVAVPITCRYLFHTILQSLEMKELHEECCQIILNILNILSSISSEELSKVLGPQLQFIVSHLVSTCVKLYEGNDGGDVTASPVFALLEQVVIHAAPPLLEYIKELSPFPDLPIFGHVRAFHSRVCGSSNLVHDFGKFVTQTSDLPPSLQLKSLQNLGRVFTRRKDDSIWKNGYPQLWSDSQGAALALFRLIRLCLGCNSSDLIDLAGDFIAKMGIGDPHAVVFGLPGHDDLESSSSSFSWGHTECVGTEMSAGVSEVLVRAILLQLKNYLIDEHVLVIELTAQTLKGLLSTEKGYKVLKNMKPKESGYIDVFSRGVNQKTVEDMLNIMRSESIKKSAALENDMLWDVSGKTYDSWVCSLVYSLTRYSEDTILRLCQGVVHCKSLLAESLLPHVLGSLAARTVVNSNICKLISSQVEKHIFCERNQNTRSIQLFLDALNELRRCDVLAHMKTGQEYAKRRENSKVYWLDLDYLQTARVAQKCGAYFTSALYIEHWCEEKFGRLTLGEPDFSDDEELPMHVELLLAVYTRINEPDGVYGVVRSHKLIPQVLMYEHEGNWSRAVGSYDLLLRNKDVMGLAAVQSMKAKVLGGLDAENVISAENFKPEWKYNKRLMRSLQQTGCDHVLKMYCKGLAVEKESLERDVEFQELQYESAWRAGKWDFHYIFPKMDNGLHSGHEFPERVNFHANLYCCLRSLHEGDAELFFSQMKCAKQELVKLISLTSLESTGNIFPSIIKLQILDCLCKSWDLRWREKKELGEKEKLLGPYIPSTEQMAIIDQDWQKRLIQMQYQFDLFEPFVAFRKILHQVLECEDLVPQQLLEFATFARKAGRINQAAAAIYELKQYHKKRRNSSDNPGVPEKLCMPAPGKVEEAKILWAQGQHEMAVNLLKYVINNYNVQEDSASVYCLTGKWLAETRSDSARIILTQYLQRAVELYENLENKGHITFIEKKSRAYYRMAQYADSLYRSYEERLNSSEWQAALRLRNHKAKELEVLTRRFKDTLKQTERRDSAKKGLQVIVAARPQDEGHDYTRKVVELQKQLAMDNEEAQRLQNDKDSFLRISLKSYRCCLTTSDKYDLRVVFRITSLWFNLSTNQGVIKSMHETINQVKSYKFLPLMYQIASRLGPLREAQGPLSFQYALTCLVRKMAVEHPYHTIYQLLALANGDRVKDKQRSKAAFIIDRDKKQAAEALLEGLMLDKKELIQQMKQLVEIYIRLAEIEVKKEDMNKKLTLPRDIRSIRQLELVPVITATIPVAPNAIYPEGCFPYFKGLSDRVIVMLGVNAPKVVECLGSDGCQYRQLAKSGNDDLRQDAVMEQLFSLVNTLLQHHPDTRKRRLGIRTYKVIPFTPSAGVLEWVDGTMPLGEYLIGSNRKEGAHSRYGTGDWTFPECREHMDKEEDKQSAFQQVCQNFRPVFHYFFLEKFAHPAEWFKKRLAYTRSVAASSMVGYIVGLGDRHSMNILIDQASAEIVHIDLGVAFEQGLMLKMPERVPFRLTRDIVDGMGVTGVEGVFRRCCENTLLVMRTNKDALLTIIEVFIHDPLYKWALSPLKALQRQKDTIEFDEAKEEISLMDSSGEANEGNRDAARALMRVKQKLDGYEGGDMRSIQGQVQQLIQDAQDPDKLSQMFPGWGAWL